jgi:hypothetical protein
MIDDRLDVMIPNRRLYSHIKDKVVPMFNEALCHGTDGEVKVWPHALLALESNGHFTHRERFLE